MFIVEFPSEWYLRGTTATGGIDRATKFRTEQEARDALAKAKKFFKRASVKAAKIVEIGEERA